MNRETGVDMGYAGCRDDPITRRKLFLGLQALFGPVILWLRVWMNMRVSLRVSPDEAPLPG